MFGIAYVITRDSMRRHLAGSRAKDPIIPDRRPSRLRRRSPAHSVK